MPDASWAAHLLAAGGRGCANTTDGPTYSRMWTSADGPEELQPGS